MNKNAYIEKKATAAAATTTNKYSIFSISISNVLFVCEHGWARGLTMTRTFEFLQKYSYDIVYDSLLQLLVLSIELNKCYLNTAFRNNNNNWSEAMKNNPEEEKNHIQTGKYKVITMHNKKNKNGNIFVVSFFVRKKTSLARFNNCKKHLK